MQHSTHGTHNGHAGAPLLWSGIWLVIVGLLTFQIGGFIDSTITAVKLRHTAAQTSGTITAVHLRDEEDMRASSITYAYTVVSEERGREHFESTQVLYGPLGAPPTLGADVTVRYVPSDPRRSSLAQIDRIPSGSAVRIEVIFGLILVASVRRLITHGHQLLHARQHSAP